MLTLALSWECNLDCRYCTIDKSKKKVISIDKAKKAIDLYFSYYNEKYPGKEKKIYFFGGEPFLHRKLLFNLTDYAKQKEKNPKFKITTNLTILNNEIIKYIKENNIELSISLDGNKETTNKNRIFPNKNKSFDIITKNLKTLNENNIFPEISMVYDPETDLLENLKFLLSLKIRSISFKPILGSVGSRNFKKVFFEFNKAADWYIDEIKNKRFHNIVLFRNMVSYIQTKKTFGLSPYCPAGLDDLFVSPEGEIYPCESFYENSQYSLGTVDNYRKDKHYFLREFSLRLSEKKNCENCMFNGFCIGFCPSLNLKKNKKIFEPDSDNFYLNTIYGSVGMKIYHAIKDKPEILSRLL